MKKICVVTAARSEYGLLKWLMYDIDKSEEFELLLVVTGGHLSYEQGHTVDQILEDGFKIFAEVNVEIDTADKVKMAKTMGYISEELSEVFGKLLPDYLVVLGDRYELLPICNTAFIMDIPIIHISGGDITEGAIDDGIRNAVTMLSTYHFPGTKDSADNIVRMRGDEKNIWAVGEPGLDAFNRESLMSREQLADNLNLDVKKKWILMTYHPETKRSLDYNLDIVKNCINELLVLNNYQVVITYANTDFGGKEINEIIECAGQNEYDKIKVVPSLGQKRYLSFMKQVEFVIGNSSSGIVEAPFLGIPVINIGDRQKGRYICGNIINCRGVREEISHAIEVCSCGKKELVCDSDYWGDGHTSERILEILKDIL